MSGEAPLVTVLGAGGFLGTAITAELSRSAYRVRAVSRRSVPAPPGTETLLADLTDPGAVERAVSGSDAVIHLVAHRTSGKSWRVGDDAHTRRVNVGLLSEVTRALGREGRRPTVVFAGSTSQAGRYGVGTIDGSEPDEPTTDYDAQKLEAERALLAATEEGAVRGLSLRLPVVYGSVPGPAGCGHGVVSVMTTRALRGESLPLWHDGAVRRDLLHVEDAARAFVTALDHVEGLGGRHWVLGSGRELRVSELFSAIAELTAARTGDAPVALVPSHPPGTALAADFEGYTIDASAFRERTGWRPRVDLREGLARTVDALAASLPRG
ncbi:NAD(P)-dependent oxidoreductase [Nocardiopsis sp. MG754419]|uniref:NAD-dependent epimerase/dehydratase family protein n=1 Tax=Nocardiopsis sp. MG754419 TaxID=2259865 RepID=UPI001BAB3685|nr:NAD-dependent epimerase/dehydratase [Nocardiopsis sp. MG754419]MBR8743448.1 NAD-dependent epimerase/dehydratase [Nocardiopsis sp. MG754419]